MRVSCICNYYICGLRAFISCAGQGEALLGGEGVLAGLRDGIDGLLCLL